MALAAKPHGFVTRGLHWLSILMIGYGYFKGPESVNQLVDPALFRLEVIFALALGALFAFRLFWTPLGGGREDRKTRTRAGPFRQDHRRAWPSFK